MGINRVNSTNFYTAPNADPSNASRKTIVFTDPSDMGKALSTGQVKVDGVSIELSEEALRALDEAREKFYADRDAETERYVAEFNGYVAKQQKEATADYARDLAKVMETARRIANGDIVPATDERKLMEFDAELYQVAKSAAMLHQMEERKKDKSLYGDEEEREYTDPTKETTPEQKFGVELEVSVGSMPAVEVISEGPIES